MNSANHPHPCPVVTCRKCGKTGTYPHYGAGHEQPQGWKDVHTTESIDGYMIKSEGLCAGCA